MKFILIIFLIVNKLWANDLFNKLKEVHFKSIAVYLHAKQLEDLSINIIPNTWVNVLKIKINNHQTWCLNFRSPWIIGTQIKKMGELNLVQKNDCEDSFFDHTEFKFEGISNFKIINEQNLNRIKLIINNQEIELKKISNGELIIENSNHQVAIGAKFITNDKDLVICHDFNKQCDEIVKNNCDLCRYGWFEGAASECNGKRIKYCGIANCGGRNLPACYRGENHTQIKGLLGCQNASLSGFCQTGLEVYCENGQLFCR